MRRKGQRVSTQALLVLARSRGYQHKDRGYQHKGQRISTLALLVLARGKDWPLTGAPTFLCRKDPWTLEGQLLTDMPGIALAVKQMLADLPAQIHFAQTHPADMLLLPWHEDTPGCILRAEHGCILLHECLNFQFFPSQTALFSHTHKPSAASAVACAFFPAVEIKLYLAPLVTAAATYQAALLAQACAPVPHWPKPLNGPNPLLGPT
eukprot:983813-Pelagomonas_calceolata.AAC.8